MPRGFSNLYKKKPISW